MANASLTLLDSFLEDPTRPTWSSVLIDDLFALIADNSRAALKELLPRVDELFSAAGGPLTKEQTHFLRDITVRNFHSTESERLTEEDLAWLLETFRSDATPQRALILALLLSLDELPKNVAALIESSLTGTPGERWIFG